MVQGLGITNKGGPGLGILGGSGFYLTFSIYQFVLQKSVRARIRRLILYKY